MFLKLSEHKRDSIPLDHVGFIAQISDSNCCTAQILMPDDHHVLIDAPLTKIRALNPEWFEKNANGSAHLFQFTRLDYELKAGDYKETPMIIPARFIADVTENVGGGQSYVLIDLRSREAVGLRRRFSNESGFNAKGGFAELQELNPNFAWPERPIPGARPAAQAAATPA